MLFLGRLFTDFVHIWRADSSLLTVLSLFVAFTIKGQTKAAAAFKGISAIYWPIVFKFGMQISYLHTKFEQNRSMDGRDRAYFVFQGCSAFLRVNRMYI